MKHAILSILLFGFAISAAAAAPKTILLWPNGAPGALGTGDADRPTLTIYLPDHPNPARSGVVICPGGGYQMLAIDYEGRDVALWLNSRGVAGFVLKYRLGPRYHHPAEMNDGLRAMRLVRSKAAEYGIRPDRIGIWGFSAGGHLASTVGTHFDAGKANALDIVDRASSRPDFMILAYPVITMKEPFVHMGSRRNLLGGHPAEALVGDLSNELRVTPQTPPTFLFQTDSDPVVPVENSVMFYMALHKNHVPAELHLFERGPHGVGLGQKYPELSIWPTLLDHWMRLEGLLD
jgi:acetyl esterase/lipase